MKTKSVVFLLVVCFSCGPEDASPDDPVTDVFDAKNATLIKTGDFLGIGHDASGTATIYESAGIRTVVLDPYRSQNGPDLKVYLSKSDDATEYINLGQLKSTIGKQSYTVPASVKVSEYPYVLIWCEQFSVLFARAKMK
ncbi:MAG TPA: DM13 domain-containing protein [Cyclobacteriaceae bacterium]|nr:DM13 domain-containing protein [Cyclobacteriaceae bacterium]